MESGDLKIERIISAGHSSPKDFWYDQSKDELVFLLKGSAVVSFRNSTQIKLSPGDYMIIPANKKHRVEQTDPDVKTVWLAVHYKNGEML